VAVAWLLPDWLGIAPDQRGGFTRVLLLTAALQPVLFLSLVFEGVLKGFERFERLRSCEVSSALAYGGLALAAGLSGWGPNWVSGALLAGLLLRFALVVLFALPLLGARQVRPARWTGATRGEVLAWSRVMLFNKTMGVMQTQIASPLIGLLLGPAAVGAFDAVVRLPRFGKTVFSLLGTSVLPVSAGLKARSDAAGLRRLGSYGILAALAISVPPLLFATAYSRSLLHYWIGDAVIDFWGWQSAMFLVALLNVAVSFGGAILLADRGAATALNRLSFWQIGVQLGLSLALVPGFGPWAFVIGQLVAAAIVFPFQLAAIRRALDLGDRLLGQFVMLNLVAGLASFGLRLLVPAPGLPALVALALGFGLAIWGTLPWLLLDRDERKLLFTRLKARLSRSRAEPGGAGLHYSKPQNVVEGVANDGALANGHGME
jgi:O-antigen/teichoic acid export membrane protein